MSSGVSVVILAAGKGTRMKSARPKVLHELCGRTLIAWVVDQACALDPDRIIVVVGEGAEDVERVAREAAGEREFHAVLQEPQKGTGHALQIAAPALGPSPGRVVVLYGDMPLLRAESLESLLAATDDAQATAILTVWSDDPTGYGRILRDEHGAFRGIVEEKDASPEERDIGEINLGVYAFAGEELLADLPKLECANAQGEYYLTDLPGLAVAAGRPVHLVELEDPEEGQGVNTIAHLAEARWAMQLRILERHMDAGVSIEDPATTYIASGVAIGAGTRILPLTVIEGGVTIGAGCEVGPFTRLRRGTVLADGAEVGNFTECKNTTLGENSKAKHLAYLGDARIGKRTNIGAGTIFANYDGKTKHQTVVGDDAFVGSGTIIIAPNSIPDGVTTGAGAVVTRSAKPAAGETWVGMPARRMESKSREPREPRENGER